MSPNRLPAVSGLHRYRLNGPDYFNAVLLTGVALLCFYHGIYLLGLLPLVLALFVGQRRRELVIDTAGNRYWLGERLFGFPLADWQPLPAAGRVMLRAYSELTGHRTKSGVVEFSPQGSYLVLLSVPGQARALRLVRVPNYPQALRLGCFLGHALGLPVFHYNQRKHEELVQAVE